MEFIHHREGGIMAADTGFLMTEDAAQALPVADAPTGPTRDTALRVAELLGGAMNTIAEAQERLDGAVQLLIAGHGGQAAGNPDNPVPVAAAPVADSAPVPAAAVPDGEALHIPPVAAADAPEGEGKAPGFLSGLAHTVAGMGESATQAVRSALATPADAGDDAYPDGGVPVAATVRTPVGLHTQAVEERRQQPAAVGGGMEV
jgi:hypothetical protein